YVLRWTISNGVCGDSFDEVRIRFDQNPTTALAGGDQTACTTSVTLAGNTPVIGAGQWSIVSGAGGSFVATTSPTSVFNGIPGTTYTLRWTTTSPMGICAVSTSDVVIQLDAAPTAALAGSDQDLCNTTSTTLAGNEPVIGTGQWTITSGAGGSFIDDEA